MQSVRAKSRSVGTRDGEHGVTLVEFALILPLFMMLVLGMVTGGHAYFRKISITDAVREGARYGVTYPAQIGRFDVWEAAVTQRVVESSGGEVKAVDVCAKLVEATDANTCGVGTPAGASGWLVKVSAQGNAKLEWLVSSTNVTVRGQAVAKYELEPS